MKALETRENTTRARLSTRVSELQAHLSSFEKKMEDEEGREDGKVMDLEAHGKTEQELSAALRSLIEQEHIIEESKAEIIRLKDVEAMRNELVTRVSDIEIRLLNFDKKIKDEEATKSEEAERLGSQNQTKKGLGAVLSTRVSELEAQLSSFEKKIEDEEGRKNEKTMDLEAYEEHRKTEEELVVALHRLIEQEQIIEESKKEILRLKDVESMRNELATRVSGFEVQLSSFDEKIKGDEATKNGEAEELEKTYRKIEEKHAAAVRKLKEQEDVIEENKIEMIRLKNEETEKRRCAID